MIPEIELDKDGYPTTAFLNEIDAICTIEEAREVLLNRLESWTGELIYASVKKLKKTYSPKDRPYWEITFTTGGWSGCEELINRLLDNFYIKMFYSMWRRGGLHQFEIPISNQ
jgi:hypothetical protein